MGEEGIAHVRFDFYTHIVPEIGHNPLKNGAETEAEDHENQNPDKGLHGTGGNVNVEDAPRQVGKQHVHKRYQKGAAHIKDEEFPVRPVEMEKLAECGFCIPKG
jgi:ATP-dependent helicase/DNAse subunit B